MDSLAPTLGFPPSSLSSWYSISNKTLLENGASSLLSKYNNSLSKLLENVYPEMKWDPLKFASLSRGYWNKMENQRKFLDELGQKLGVDKKEKEKEKKEKDKEVEEEKNYLEGWYGITGQAVYDNGGVTLYNKYGGSLYKMLSVIYPEVAWDPMKFSQKVPQNAWASEVNQKAFMEGLALKLGFNKGNYDAWYNVSNQTIIDNGGVSLLDRHDNSLSRLLSSVFPEHKWDPLKFIHVPRNYWSSLDNQKNFMIGIGRKLGIQDGDYVGWYQVPAEKVIELGGASLLKMHDSSLSKLLLHLFPEFDWDPLKFPQVPRGYWKRKDNQRHFMEKLAKELAIDGEGLEGWYKVTTEKLIAHGGGAILKEYNNSWIKLLSEVYPEFSWDPLKFTRTPQGYWNSLDHQRKFLDNLGSLLGFKEGERESWYRISKKTIVDNGGSAILERYSNSLLQLLTAVYPDFSWDPIKFSQVPRNFWDSIENQRSFLSDLSKKLSLGFDSDVQIDSRKNYEAWYKVSSHTILDSGGATLLNRYQGSVSKLLVNVFPEFSWDPLKFMKAPNTYWDSLENQKSYLLELGKEKFGIKEGDMEAWYKVTSQSLLDNGGSALLSRYGNSLYKLFKAVFPEYDWKEWRFVGKSAQIFSDEKGLSEVLTSIETALEIRSPREWHRVNRDQLLSLGVAKYFTNSRNRSKKSLGETLLKALKIKYPEEKWDDAAFLGKASSEEN